MPKRSYQVPFRIAFSAAERLGRPYLVPNQLVDAALVADVGVRLCTAFINTESALVADLPSIARHYLGATALGPVVQ